MFNILKINDIAEVLLTNNLLIQINDFCRKFMLSTVEVLSSYYRDSRYLIIEYGKKAICIPTVYFQLQDSASMKYVTARFNLVNDEYKLSEVYFKKDLEIIGNINIEYNKEASIIKYDNSYVSFSLDGKPTHYYYPCSYHKGLNITPVLKEFIDKYKLEIGDNFIFRYDLSTLELDTIYLQRKESENKNVDYTIYYYNIKTKKIESFLEGTLINNEKEYK